MADAAETVISASKYAAGMSTEFLGDSRIALRSVWSRGEHRLSRQARADLLGVLKQLDAALDGR